MERANLKIVLGDGRARNWKLYDSDGAPFQLSCMVILIQLKYQLSIKYHMAKKIVSS